MNMQIELSLNDNIKNIQLEIEPLKIDSSNNYNIQLKNLTPYDFIIQECQVKDQNGYLQVLNSPKEVEGNGTQDINILISIPKSANSPLKGNVSIKGYFIIK